METSNVTFSVPTLLILTLLLAAPRVGIAHGTMIQLLVSVRVKCIRPRLMLSIVQRKSAARPTLILPIASKLAKEKQLHSPSEYIRIARCNLLLVAGRGNISQICRTSWIVFTVFDTRIGWWRMGMRDTISSTMLEIVAICGTPHALIAQIEEALLLLTQKMKRTTWALIKALIIISPISTRIVVLADVIILLGWGITDMKNTTCLSKATSAATGTSPLPPTVLTRQKLSMVIIGKVIMSVCPTPLHCRLSSTRLTTLILVQTPVSREKIIPIGWSRMTCTNVFIFTRRRKDVASSGLATLLWMTAWQKFTKVLLPLWPTPPIRPLFFLRCGTQWLKIASVLTMVTLPILCWKMGFRLGIFSTPRRNVVVPSTAVAFE